MSESRVAPPLMSMLSTIDERAFCPLLTTDTSQICEITPLVFHDPPGEVLGCADTKTPWVEQPDDEPDPVVDPADPVVDPDPVLLLDDGPLLQVGVAWKVVLEITPLP